MVDYLDAAVRLHRHMVEQHWDGEVLTGPDPGIRFNARIGRFVKGYLSVLPWKDDLTYIQAQGYWIISNGTPRRHHWLRRSTRELAEATSEERDGAPDRRRLLGLSEPRVGRADRHGRRLFRGPWPGLDTFERTEDPKFLEAALAWESYLRSAVGYRRQDRPDMLAVNYFAHVNDHVGGVPNNSTLVLWLLARLYEVTGAESYMDQAAPLVKWLQSTQLESGELPYFVGNAREDRPAPFPLSAVQRVRVHGLGPLSAHYRRSDGSPHDAASRRVPQRWHDVIRLRTLRLRHGLDRSHLLHGRARRKHSAKPTALGFGDYSALTEAGYRRVLETQRADGSFRFYSKGNYRVAQDRRSYPRYLAMILNHLILAHRTAAVANGPA